MKIPALILEWLELKMAESAEKQLRLQGGPKDPAELANADARWAAYFDVYEKLKELS